MTKQAYDEYVKRLRPVLALDTQWHKTDEDLEAAVRKDTGVVVRHCTHITLTFDPRFRYSINTCVHDCTIHAECLCTKASQTNLLINNEISVARAPRHQRHPPPRTHRLSIYTRFLLSWLLSRCAWTKAGVRWTLQHSRNSSSLNSRRGGRASRSLSVGRRVCPRG